MAAKRTIAVVFSTEEDGFGLKVTESETITDEETGLSHTESEKSSQKFAQPKTAIEAATKTLDRFIQRLSAADGELFA